MYSLGLPPSAEQLKCRVLRILDDPASAREAVRSAAKERYNQPGIAGSPRSRFAGPAKPILPDLPLFSSAIFAGLVLLCSVTLTTGNLLSIGFVFEHNYNEGWNVYNLQRIIDHNLVYDHNYWRVNNYPLGSFLIVASINFLVHNLLLSGRIVALVSYFAIGALAAVATRSFGGDRIDAIFGGACTLGFCYLVAPAWIMVDDPQTLGEAVMLGGLVTYISRTPNHLSLFLAALIVVLGGFIKQNLVAIPLVITIDLAVRSPRRLFFWLACGAGLGAGFLGLTQIVAGGSFIDHLLSPRVFTWYGMRYHLMKYLRLLKFPLIAIVMFSPVVFSGNRIILVIWGIISILVATIFSGLEGTSYNMFQDSAVFLGIATGVMFCELRKRGSRGAVIRGRFAGIVFGVMPLLLAQPILARSTDAFLQIYHGGALLEFNRRAEREFLAEAKYVSERRAAAICESLLLCFVAGQPFILDPFNSRQYILAGRLDQGELIRRIAGHEFAVIQLRADICDDPATASCHILHYPQKFNRFTDETLYAIDHYYKVERRSQDGTFYVPR